MVTLRYVRVQWIYDYQVNNMSVNHPISDSFILNSFWQISAGVTIGLATSSSCKNHVHIAMKRDGGFIDPTRFVVDRQKMFQPYVTECKDWKLVIKVCSHKLWKYKCMLKIFVMLLNDFLWYVSALPWCENL